MSARAQGGAGPRRPPGAPGVGPLFILLAAVILALGLGVWLSRGPAQPASLLGERGAADKLMVQINAIRTVLQSCTQQYPAGSNGVGGLPAFPGGAGVALGGLLCPGAPAARRPLWGGSYGLFLQPAVAGYSWTYSNDASGVRVVAVAAAGASVNTLARVAQQLGNVEVSVDTAARTLTVWIVR